MKPFNREKFLLYVLATIFFFQAAIFASGFFFCATNGGLKVCPEIGRRYENTFSVQIATVLALLGSGAVLQASKKPSSGDQASSSQDRLRQQMRQSPPRKEED